MYWNLTIITLKHSSKEVLPKSRSETKKGAIDDFSKALVHSPKDPEALAHRANIRYLLSDYAGSIKDYTTLYRTCTAK